MPFNRFRKNHETEANASDGDPSNEHEDAGDGMTATGAALTKRRIAPRTPQFGSGLCGYLAAVGCYLVIVAIVDAVVTKIGSGAARNVGDALGMARLNQPATVHWNGAIALLVLAFIACLVGGYVCGTMARAHGALEGISVWLWAASAAVVVSLIVELSSTKYDSLYQIDLFPRIHVGSLHGTAAAIISAIVIAAAGLLGAILGGVIGAASHRRVRVLDDEFRSRR